MLDDEGVRWMEPFGFHDYNHLQLRRRVRALATRAPSPRSRRSSASPPITLRDSIERPEALDSGSIMMTGLDADDVEAAVGIAIADGPVTSSIPAGYEISDTSRRVLRFVVSTASRDHVWSGVRRGREALAVRSWSIGGLAVRFYVDEAGVFSGGGQAVLENCRFAARRHAILNGSKAAGDVPFFMRNVPGRGSHPRGPYIWGPQNALPWTRFLRGPRELWMVGRLRAGSEWYGRRATAQFRASSAIPVRAKPCSAVIHNVLDEGLKRRCWHRGPRPTSRPTDTS